MGIRSRRYVVCRRFAAAGACVIGAFGCSVIAQLQFSEERFPVGEAPNSITSGDFNSDGILDLVVTNSRSGTLSILLGRGDGSFHSGSSYIVGRSPHTSAVGDLDGDGHEDIVVATRWSGGVSVLLGLGDGSFQDERRLGIAPGSNSIAVRDFDGDGNLDLASVRSRHVSVYLGLGDGSFRASWDRSVFFGYALAVADFDSDGTDDLGVSSLAGDDVMFFLGLGDGQFTWGGIYVAYGSAPYSMVAGDFNCKGKVDLAIANEYSSHVSVLFEPHDKPFYPEFASFPTGNLPRSVASGDIDGDGALDLATANRGSGDLSVLLGGCDGSFADEERFAVGNGPLSIVMGDFDGDGNTDLSTANFESNDISVLINQACPKNDDVPPEVTILEPQNGYIVPLPPATAPLSFETNDDEDGFRGGVLHERVLLEDCVILDGSTVGDGDGLLSDEELSLDPAILCAAAQACGLRVLVNPLLTVEAEDCAGNVGSDSRSLRGVVALRPGLCI